MKIEFDSLAELQEFLTWLRSAQPVAAPPVVDATACVRVVDAAVAAEPMPDAPAVSISATRKPRAKKTVASPAAAAIPEAEVSAAVIANPTVADPLVPLALDAARQDVLAAGIRVAPIAHLHECQHFIKSHGIERYNESFKFGLTNNLTAYTAKQRALHVAILDEMSSQS